MIWTRDRAIKSVTSEPDIMFYLTSELFKEISAKVAEGETVRVDDIAVGLAENFRKLSSHYGHRFGRKYEDAEVIYHPENTTPAEELGRRRVKGFVDGIQLLVDMRNGELERLGNFDAALYVRCDRCKHDEGIFNNNALVLETKDLGIFQPCSNPKFSYEKECRSIGQNGFLVETER
jgi:hypothetical protein